MHAQSFSHSQLFCDPMDCSPPGSYVHGIFQARILELVAISSSRGSSWPRNWTPVSCVSCIGRQFLYPCPTWEAHNEHDIYIHVSLHRICFCLWINSWRKHRRVKGLTYFKTFFYIMLICSSRSLNQFNLSLQCICGTVYRVWTWFKCGANLLAL